MLTEALHGQCESPDHADPWSPPRRSGASGVSDIRSSPQTPRRGRSRV